MIERCPAPKERCPHYYRQTPLVLRGQQSHGCFSDTDHKVPQRLARLETATELEKAYILESEANKQQLCRWLHDIKNIDYDAGYIIPSVQEMVIALTVSLEEPAPFEEDSPS